MLKKKNLPAILHIQCTPQLNSFSCLHASSFVKVFRKSKGYSLTWDHRRFNYVCFLNKSKCVVAHNTAKQFFMSSCKQLVKVFRKSKGFSLTWDHRKFGYICFLNKSQYLVAHTTAKQFFMSSCKQLCESLQKIKRIFLDLRS